MPVLLLAPLLAAPPAARAAPQATEAGVKAAYLVKFLSYVEWPEGSLAGRLTPQVIGVLGADAVLAELQLVLASRPAGARPLRARRLLPGAPLDGVDVLHVGRGSSPPPLPVGRPLLVVSDVPQGLPAGSALNFVTVGRRVRFEAAPLVAEHAGLKLSARLLAVAERVVAQ